MQSVQIFMAAIFMATLALVGASPTINGSIIASTLTLGGATVTINDSIITSTLTVIGASATIHDGIVTSSLIVGGPGVYNNDSITPSTASITTDSTAISISPYPLPSGIPLFRNCKPCYCEGETWDQLGTWEEISNALQDSGIVSVTSIPEGYHVSENIRVNDHCFIFEIGVDTGESGIMTPAQITDQLNSAHTKCPHGGRWSLAFVSGDGDIIGRGWLTADPQGDSDCS